MSWRTILRSLKNKEMQQKFIAVIFMVLIFRALAHVQFRSQNQPNSNNFFKASSRNSRSSVSLISYLAVL